MAIEYDSVVLPFGITTPLSLTIELGGRIGITGPSGSGKTSLLRAAVGLVNAVAGEIRIDGNSVHSVNRYARSMLVQLVSQDARPSLNPRRTVGQNLFDVVRERFDDGPERASAAIAICGITPDMIDRYPGQLSGGEAQRVALVRAMLLQPRYLLVDEPFTALDYIAMESMVNVLQIAQRADGFGLVIVSHEQRLLSRLCDTCINLVDEHNGNEEAT